MFGNEVIVVGGLSSPWSSPHPPPCSASKPVDARSVAAFRPLTSISPRPHRMLFFPLLLSSVLLPSLALAEELTEQTVTIHHRVLPFASASSSSSLPSFTPRLRVHLTSPTSSDGLSSSLPSSTVELVGDEMGVIDSSRDEWYQIALEVDGQGPSEWAFTTVKAVSPSRP